MFLRLQVTIKQKQKSLKSKNDSNLTNIKEKLTEDDVTKLVLNKYKSGTVQSVNLEYEDGKLVYEVEMIVDGIEHDIDIDANSGNILEDEIDDHDLTETSEEANENKEEDNLKQLAKITVDQVKIIVSNKYKDGTIVEVDLENENGNIVYEVEVITKDGVHDIIIDAENGNILFDEIDE